MREFALVLESKRLLEEQAQELTASNHSLQRENQSLQHTVQSLQKEMEMLCQGRKLMGEELREANDKLLAMKLHVSSSCPHTYSLSSQSSFQQMTETSDVPRIQDRQQHKTHSPPLSPSPVSSDFEVVGEPEPPTSRAPHSPLSPAHRGPLANGSAVNETSAGMYCSPIAFGMMERQCPVCQQVFYTLSEREFTAHVAGCFK